MSIRLSSKTQLAAGRLVAVEQDIRVVPAFLAGTLVDGAEFGSLRIQGRDHELVGWRVDFQTPASWRSLRSDFQVKSADNVFTIPDSNTRLTILGTNASGELLLDEPYVLPVGSLWKVVVYVNTDDAVQGDLPQNVTFQWLVRPTIGPASSRAWSASRPFSGEADWRPGQL